MLNPEGAYSNIDRKGNNDFQKTSKILKEQPKKEGYV